MAEFKDLQAYERICFRRHDIHFDSWLDLLIGNGSIVTTKQFSKMVKQPTTKGSKQNFVQMYDAFTVWHFATFLR